MRLLTVPGVFRPRSDSLMLARRIAAEVEPGQVVLDPFSGSGVLAITAALAGAKATAVDISRRAVACAWSNARLNGTRIRARCGDMFAPVAEEQFDLIVANPPYLPAVSDPPARGAARAWEGGIDGRRVLDRLCRSAVDQLKPGGRVLVVQSSVCDPEATAAALSSSGLTAEVVERRRGPLGPLLRARAPLLERAGMLKPGQREEELLVIAARRAGRVGAPVAGNGRS